MNKPDIVSALKRVDAARTEHETRAIEFTAGVDDVMRRLLHEAMAARMSPEEVARLSGFTVKQIRSRMRVMGLNPAHGKTVLSQTAAEALANNAALLGIEPDEMDLMSPLAYLPMGEQMKRELQNRTVSQVHEDEDFAVHEELANIIYDNMPWEGESYQAVAENIAAMLRNDGWCKA